MTPDELRVHRWDTQMMKTFTQISWPTWLAPASPQEATPTPARVSNLALVAWLTPRLHEITTPEDVVTPSEEERKRNSDRARKHYWGKKGQVAPERRWGKHL